MSRLLHPYQKMKELKLSECRKVCLILGLDGNCGIFIIDVDADSNEEASVSVDGHKFVETRPNLRLRFGPKPLCLCVVDATLYLFYFDVRRNGNPASPPEVYSYKLSPEVSQFSDVLLEESMLQKEVSGADRLTSKVLPEAVGYRGKILLLSTSIRFCDKLYGDDFDRIDFEIYDPKERVYQKLPQLLVCPVSRSRSEIVRNFKVKVFDGRSRWEEFSVSHNYDKVSAVLDFQILSFGLHGSQFLVHTDFGRMLSLDLELPNAGWKLCEEGIRFDHRNQNIVTRNGLFMTAFGVKAFKPKNEVERRGFFFPVSDIAGSLISGSGPYSFGITLLGDYPTCTPIIVQLAFDSSSEMDCSSSKLYWFVDELRVDLRKFSIEARDKKKADDIFGKCIKSLKFCLKNKRVFMSDIVGLFPC